MDMRPRSDIGENDVAKRHGGTNHRKFAEMKIAAELPPAQKNLVDTLVSPDIESKESKQE
jgi:hypothetical protein